MSSTEKATRCMPISLGRVGSVSIASGWMYSKSSRRPLPSGVWSKAMLAWLPSRPTAVSVHSPLTVSRPRTVSPRSVKKAIVASRSRTAMPTFSNLMGMRARYRDAGDLLRPTLLESRTTNGPVPLADRGPGAQPVAQDAVGREPGDRVGDHAAPRRAHHPVAGDQDQVGDDDHEAAGHRSDGGVTQAAEGGGDEGPVDVEQGDPELGQQRVASGGPGG